MAFRMRGLAPICDFQDWFVILLKWNIFIDASRVGVSFLYVISFHPQVMERISMYFFPQNSCAVLKSNFFKKCGISLDQPILAEKKEEHEA